MSRRIYTRGGLIVAILIATGGFLLLSRTLIPATSQAAATERGEQSRASRPYAYDLDQLVNGRGGAEALLAVDLVLRRKVVAAQSIQVPFVPASPPPAWKQRASLSPTPPLATETHYREAARPDYQTEYRVQVEEVVIGVASSPTVMMNTPAALGGPTITHPSLPPSLPRLAVGEEYLLFLIHRPDGNYAPIGVQGVLAIRSERVEPILSDVPVLKGLDGQPVAEVIQRIKQARQQSQ